MIELLVYGVIYTLLVAFLGAWFDRHTRKVKVQPLVKRVMDREQGKKQVNIAQMYEIANIFLDELGIKGVWK